MIAFVLHCNQAILRCIHMKQLTFFTIVSVFKLRCSVAVCFLIYHLSTFQPRYCGIFLQT